jgi:transposase
VVRIVSNPISSTTSISISRSRSNFRPRQLENLLPQSKTNNDSISRHEIINAILYQLKNGCQWRDLPSDFPKWQTVYSQFRRWRLNGTWKLVLAELAKIEREGIKKKNIPAC